MNAVHGRLMSPKRRGLITMESIHPATTCDMLGEITGLMLGLRLYDYIQMLTVIQIMNSASYMKFVNV